MDTNLFLANAAFGIALMLSGILIRVLFARVATNEATSNERFAKADQRLAAVESMHVGSKASHDALEKLFEAKFEPLKHGLASAEKDIRSFRDLLHNFHSDVSKLYNSIEIIAAQVQILKTVKKNDRQEHS
jgi:hypothetical protein